VLELCYIANVHVFCFRLHGDIVDVCYECEWALCITFLVYWMYHIEVVLLVALLQKSGLFSELVRLKELKDVACFTVRCWAKPSPTIISDLQR
jgi:hypothetical protein